MLPHRQVVGFGRVLVGDQEVLGQLYLNRLSQRERQSALREMRDTQDKVFARRASAAKLLGK
ncbi:hypothetical protein ACLMNJ_15780 [Streptomyces seoulensis]